MHARRKALQGTVNAPAGIAFGDGVRCAAGALIRLAAKPAPGGAAQFPVLGDPSVSVRGGVVPGSGSSRVYQTYYRDPNPSFCPSPMGSTWNVTNGVLLTW